MDARNRLHAAPVAMRQAAPVHRLRGTDVRAAVLADRNHVVGRQHAGHARAPQHLLRRARDRPRWWISSSSARHPAALSCTPVISSSCDSLKSVVMCGCVRARPSASGCGVSASIPSGARAGSPSRRRAGSARAASGQRGESLVQCRQSSSRGVASSLHCLECTERYSVSGKPVGGAPVWPGGPVDPARRHGLAGGLT